MRRTVIIGILTALVATACGGGNDDAATTTEPATTLVEVPDQTSTTEAATATTEPARPAEFLLTEADNGAVLRVQPGDAITIRLPIEDPSNPLWILAREPDPAIVEIADSLLWTPSEPGAVASHFEFLFFVVGTGDTEITFSLGPMTPTSRTIGFTVQSG